MSAIGSLALNGAFSRQNQFFQTIWDATSLDSFIRDPFTYYFQNIEGWKSGWASAAQLFGRLYGEAIGQYCAHRSRSARSDDAHEEALDHALEYAIRKAAIGEGGDPLDIIASNSRRGDANRRDTYRLLRAVVWWCDQFGDDPKYTTISMPSGRPAIEEHFMLPLGIKVGGEDILICGHLDNVVRAETGELIVREWKHTTASLGREGGDGKRYFNRYKPNVQINHYSLASQIIFPREPVRGVLVEACQTAVGFARFEREWIDRAPSSIEEWAQCVAYQVGRAHALAKESLTLMAQGEDPHLPWAYAMNPVSIRQYGDNVFADAAFKLPRLRRAFLSSQCVRGERWDPTIARVLED